MKRRIPPIKVDGRAIVPLRAIWSLSAGEISPLAVAIAIAERSPFLDRREFATKLDAYWLADNSEPCRIAPADFAVMRDAVWSLVEAGAPRVDQISALPAGVFVYRDDLDVLVRELNAVRCIEPPDGPGLPPIELSDWPRVERSDEALVFEGFADLGEATVDTDPAKNSKGEPEKGYDLRLQRRAEEVAKELRGRLGRWPTKHEVAKVIALEEGKEVANILRRFRNTWTPGRRGRRSPR